MEYVVSIESVNRNSVNLVGGKGASLGEMNSMQIVVPSAFFITTRAFKSFLAHNNLQKEIDELVGYLTRSEKNSDVAEISTRIQHLFKQANITPDIESEIKESLAALQTSYVAVRSSAVAEDGNGAAWAGQLETFLNVDGESLTKRIKECWASIYSARAIQYRFLKNEEVCDVAVVVQKMICSDVSGVSFSVHPITENSEHVFSEAVLGLGEGLVSGAVQPSNFTISKKNSLIIEKDIVSQTKALYCSQRGGKEWRALSNNNSVGNSLREEILSKLTHIICRLEEHYGFPVDVEWALEGDQIYILQCRPITTLTPF